MKLSKFIPSLSILSVAATAAPLTLTSCSCVAMSKLKDVDIVNGYNPGKQSSQTTFDSIQQLNEAYSKLDSATQAKDYIYDHAEEIKSIFQTNLNVPFEFAELSEATITIENWYAKLDENKNINLSYSFILMLSGKTNDKETYIPAGSDVTVKFYLESVNTPYTFQCGYKKTDKRQLGNYLVPAESKLKTNKNWNISAQANIVFRKKYSDKETISKVDSTAVYWDYENVYDESQEEEYAKKSYIVPFIHRSEKFESFYFKNATVKQ